MNPTTAQQEHVSRNGSGPAAPFARNLDAGAFGRLAGTVRTQGDRPALEVECPFTATPLGTVPRCDGDDVAAAAERVRAAQKAWRTWSLDERADVMLRLHDLILRRQGEVLDIIQLENGKARRHAFEEVLDVAITARYYARSAGRHLAPERRQGALPLLTRTTEVRHPLGVVGIISPWNYPLTLSISDAIPALMAGNGVLIKPDAQTPFACLWATELLREAGLPTDLMGVVTGRGSELGEPIADNSDYLMFTGSSATGRIIGGLAAERLIGFSAELGGKNAMIVCDDASIDRAVEGAERACFSNTGQLCISIERLFVHESVYDEFARRFADRTRSMRIGVSLDWGPEVGTLISRAQLETVTSQVAQALEHGASLLAGGRHRPDIGPYVHEPTLLENVRPGMTLCAEETFGPVVALYPYSSEDEVVERANDSEYGLNFSVWTRDTRRGEALAARLEAGTVNVNEGYAAAWGSVDSPMGGFKASGIGRRHGGAGIQKYTEAQTIAVQRLMGIAPPPGVPAELYAKAMSKSLGLLKRLPWIE